jgi:uncharacterized protein YcaQ
LTARQISTSIEAIRRLAVTKQHLAGNLQPKPTGKNILSVVRDLAYVQWDPISVIAPSHIISLWSRIGNFRLSDLDRLLWEEKKLFQHWTPIASIVLTEDYPLYYSLMRRYPESLLNSWRSHMVKAKKFLAEQADLRKRVLNGLKKGPRQLSQFEDHRRTGKSADGWTSRSEVSHTLFHLLMSGDVMVVGHQGNQNVWGLSEDFLPIWVERKMLTEEEVEREAAQRAIRALGTASPSETNYYFVRGRYQHLKKTLESLQEESRIHRVQVEALGGKDERYIHDEDISLLESMNSDAWQPRMSLLAPFDNLIVGRARTNRLFGFDYVHEQFLPKEKRKFGTFVLPILWGDSLIGRTDLRTDRENEKLLVNSVHAQRGAPSDKETSLKIAETIRDFADFLGAKEVEYTTRVPAAWKTSLR